MKTHSRPRTRRGLAALAGLVLLLGPLAACGDDDDAGGGRPEPIASITDLSQEGGTTAVALDADTLKALAGLGVEPTPYGTAELDGGSIVFPITGGNVTIFEKDAVPRYVVGQLQHEGSGLTLTAGETTVVVGNFDVDPTVSVVYGDVVVDGKVAATSIPVLALDGRTLRTPSFNDGNVVLTGSGVFLTAGAAALLNRTFDVDALSTKTQIGVATITANTPPS